MSRHRLGDLSELLQGEARFGEPLAGYTTYRIGGPAAALVHPASTDDVVRTLRFAADRGMRWMALGLGSNLLVSDAGFDGIVIRMGKGLDAVEEGVLGDRRVWRVGAGLPTPILARRTAHAGLAGVQRLIGVPGSVGGGVFMNAGAHGQDFASVTRSVDCIDSTGERKAVAGSGIGWRYRSSGLKSVVVLGATIELEPGARTELDEDIRRHLAWRREGTPFSEACCGSVFRNPDPEGLPVGGPRTAGQLIDAAGLKGFRVGGAEVSDKHANYIVNVGAASASDVLGVIDAVRGKVLAEFGVELELELQVAGD